MTNASPRSIQGDIEKKNCFVKIPSSRFLKFTEDDIVSRNVSDCLESSERIFLTRVQRERDVGRNTETTSDDGRATSTLGTNSGGKALSVTQKSVQTNLRLSPP